MLVQEENYLREVGHRESIAELLHSGAVRLLAVKVKHARVQVVVAEKQDAKDQDRPFARDIGGESGPSRRKTSSPDLERLVVQALNCVAEDAASFRVVFKERAHAVVGSQFFQVRPGRSDELLVDTAAVLMLRDVAFRFGETRKELPLALASQQLLG